MEIELRPPLPPKLAHDGITFVCARTSRLSSEVVAAIGAALHALLPPGDISVLPSGQIQFSSAGPQADSNSLWHRAGRLEGIERSVL